MWAKITPNRLPRGYSCLIIGTVYHPPPPAKDEPLLDYMMDSLSRIESDIPGAGIILAGDWNRANVSPVIKQFRLTQVVHFPTRGDRTLDKVLTNLTEHYEKPSPFRVKVMKSTLIVPFFFVYSLFTLLWILILAGFLQVGLCRSRILALVKYELPLLSFCAISCELLSVSC